jgi:hypothetical protein
MVSGQLLELYSQLVIGYFIHHLLIQISLMRLYWYFINCSWNQSDTGQCRVHMHNVFRYAGMPLCKVNDVVIAARLDCIKHTAAGWWGSYSDLCLMYRSIRSHCNVELLRWLISLWMYLCVIGSAEIFCCSVFICYCTRGVSRWTVWLEVFLISSLCPFLQCSWQ